MKVALDTLISLPGPRGGSRLLVFLRSMVPGIISSCRLCFGLAHHMADQTHTARANSLMRCRYPHFGDPCHVVVGNFCGRLLHDLRRSMPSCKESAWATLTSVHTLASKHHSTSYSKEVLRHLTPNHKPRYLSTRLGDRGPCSAGQSHLLKIGLDNLV